jgi:hypothetical protein
MAHAGGLQSFAGDLRLAEVRHALLNDLEAFLLTHDGEAAQWEAVCAA